MFLVILFHKILLMKDTIKGKYSNDLRARNIVIILILTKFLASFSFHYIKEFVFQEQHLVFQLPLTRPEINKGDGNGFVKSVPKK